MHVSPMEVIPKSEPGMWCIIVDLLSPEGSSVNDGINREVCSLSYMSVDEVAARLVRLGKEHLWPCSTLRQRTGMCQYIQMTGGYSAWPGRISCMWMRLSHLGCDQCLQPLMQEVAEALSFLIKEKEVKWIDHYLDDYIVLGPPSGSGHM